MRVQLSVCNASLALAIKFYKISRSMLRLATEPAERRLIRGPGGSLGFEEGRRCGVELFSSDEPGMATCHSSRLTITTKGPIDSWSTTPTSVFSETLSGKIPSTQRGSLVNIRSGYWPSVSWEQAVYYWLHAPVLPCVSAAQLDGETRKWKHPVKHINAGSVR